MEDTETQSNTNKKEMREKDLIAMFKAGKIQFKLVSTYKSWDTDTKESLLAFKMILQKQLPRMPKEYIIKQIFNEKHRNILCLIDGTIVGGISYRPFYEQSFVELVFLAIDSNVQVNGHGSMIIDILKEHCKREIQNIETDFLEYLSYPKRLKHPIYLMAYADNYAIGFFKKQGFSTEIYFKNWRGYIKDYEGGTLMQCKVLWEINYLNKIEIVERKRMEFINKISQLSSFNVLRDPPNFDDIKTVWDIPGLREAKLTEEMLSQTTKKLKNVFRYIISDIRTDTHAWPFLQPVNEKEVPDYYQIIKTPMDISKIEQNVEDDKYESLEVFEQDFALIFKNCYIYNAPSTTYCKCAHVLEKRFKERMREVKKTLNGDKSAQNDRHEKEIPPKHSTPQEVLTQNEYVSPPVPLPSNDFGAFKNVVLSSNSLEKHERAYEYSDKDKKNNAKGEIKDAQARPGTTEKKRDEQNDEEEKSGNLFDINFENHHSEDFF
ncbi:Histone acetyltransferase SAGA/ADA, catalytic subunit PCAF/GCN5 [Trachipleistophora hominis]|uniref:histone acetyltransferase n=1 Tax=Trachipleistophora hominis TaxID=72359 RepID=L7JWF0_TRAHO|nr:Histone acetyltransferase SAGA/ADA, catalytic subunit PCAF/GCN5 [Trachipleistophora hominis]